jgi:hypothetical protein
LLQVSNTQASQLSYFNFLVPYKDTGKYSDCQGVKKKKNPKAGAYFSVFGGL